MIRTITFLVVVIVWAVVAAAQDPPQTAIPNVISAGARVETVRGGFQGVEGPVSASDGTLYFSDIPANRTYKLDPSGAISVWREDTKGTNGRLYVATGSGVQVIDPKGSYLGTIRVPTVVRNVAFGGPKRQTLYMTALGSLYRVQMLSQGPADRAK